MNNVTDAILPRTAAPKQPVVDRLSASQVRAYATCPLQWYLSRLHEPEFVPASLVFGSAFHNAMHAYWQGALEGRTVGVPELMTAFGQTWQQEKHEVRFNKTETVDSLRDMAQRMLEAYVAQAVATAVKVLALEERFLCRISDDLPPFLGYMDFIGLGKDQDGTEYLSLVDFKTSANRSNACDLGTDQLVIYALAAKRSGLVDEFGLPLRLSYSVVTKTKVPEVFPVPVTATDRDVARTVAKAKACYRGMTQGVVYPCQGWQCAGCGHQARCAKWPDVNQG
jgi:RecB family exonuclease